MMFQSATQKEERERIENDTWEKIDILKDKNKEDLAVIIDQGMQSKCNLTLVHNDYKKKKSEQMQKQNDIKTKQQELSAAVVAVLARSAGDNHCAQIGGQAHQRTTVSGSSSQTAR